MLKKILIAAGVVVVLVVAFVFVARRVSSTVHVERVFDAPVTQVWHRWTDEKAMTLWWSPKDFTAPVIRNDFKVGGKFHWSMRSPKGEMFWNTGSYTEIVPGKKIVSTMSFADENGNAVTGSQIPVPGVWPDAITVETVFTEDNGKTKVAVTETGIPLIMKLFAKMGWEQQLDKFELLIKKK